MGLARVFKDNTQFRLLIHSKNGQTYAKAFDCNNSFMALVHKSVNVCKVITLFIVRHLR